jgi:hypothetical protein
MRLPIVEIVQLQSVKSYRIRPSNQWIPQCSVIGDPDLQANDLLYVPTRSSDLSWYNSRFDRGLHLSKLMKEKKDWIFVVEDTTQLIEDIGSYILVSSLDQFLEQLLSIAIHRSRVQTVAVTGSVGKTTLARILSIILPQSQLLDVKRLTPLNLFDFILNRMSPDTRFLVAELGLFYRDQVAILARLLHPQLGILIDVYDMHLNWNGIHNRTDLLTDKMALIEHSQHGLVSSELRIKYGPIVQRDNVILTHKPENIEELLELSSILPNTKVSECLLELTIAALRVLLRNEHLDAKIVCHALSAGKIDTRLKYLQLGVTGLFLDTHSSIAGYFQAMSDHNYTNAILAILSLHFGTEPLLDNLRLIFETFGRFQRVVIEKGLRKYFSSFVSENVVFVSYRTYFEEIMQSSIVFLHDPEAKRISRNFESRWKALTTAST